MNSFNRKYLIGFFMVFFSRDGGLSEGVLAGLNCGIGTHDPLAFDNRALVANQAGVEPKNLLSLYQEHGARCIVVDGIFKLDENRPKADAFVTDQAGIGLGILTADCAPVLFYGQKENDRPVIGAAHAGWKGALAGVLESTVVCMKDKKDVRLETISAVVGPCLSKRNFEVQPDFAEKFIEESEESEIFFSTDRKNRLVFDLSGYCAYRLSRCGVKSVALMDVDTYPEEAGFYSYRRATHKGETEYGRHISVISLHKS